MVAVTYLLIIKIKNLNQTFKVSVFELEAYNYSFKQNIRVYRISRIKYLCTGSDMLNHQFKSQCIPPINTWLQCPDE